MRESLVIGASGLLGSYLVKMASEKGMDVAGTYHSNESCKDDSAMTKLDITRERDVTDLISNVEPKFIILSSALTNVDYCEKHPEEAEAINVRGVENVAKAAAGIGAKMVYVSTDYVFDGEKGNYAEDDHTNPISVYGKTKLEGEFATRKHCDDHLICRVCVVYGWSPPGRGKNFVEWVLEMLREGKEIDLAEDQYVTPTYARSASELMLALIERDSRGTYHVSGKECINRLDMGMKISKVFGLNVKRIRAGRFEDLNLPAKRPKNSCLNTGKVEKELNITIGSLEDDLETMKNESRERAQ